MELLKSNLLPTIQSPAALMARTLTYKHHRWRKLAY